MFTVGYREALVLTLNADELRTYSTGRRINNSKIIKVEVQQVQHWIDYRLTLEDGEVVQMTHAGPYNIWWKTDQTTPTKLPWIPLNTGALPSPDPEEPEISVDTLVTDGKRYDMAYLHFPSGMWYDTIIAERLDPQPTHFLELTQ